MIKCLTTPFLLLCFLFLIACSKDDVAHPQATTKTLANTKWDLTTWGTGTGTESSIQPGEHVYYHFLDGENLKRINEEPCCPTTIKEYTYQLKNDTLITNVLLPGIRTTS
ncbi:hypothetical protein Q0590_32995 [Rhodocytophaga aerolata]|uniref:Uncharacterized protein n=1 Tax=Rhodocytophaga aerolata TaxID=455078 RepID=A0ABT8RIX9_9BACT|nr:hypothetical protein [Rhodocytophaga aerolata]MDO1451138.1 hypothetical protein [Rhodocytophaga aerolata]